VDETSRRRWAAAAPAHETLVERQIRLAQERGDFDDLPGKGKPLPGLDGPDDEDWWVKGYLRREGLSAEPLLPTPLQLRREIERLPDTVAGLPDERTVREVARELNRRIAQWLRAPVGPAVPVGPVDVDAVVARWRADRAALLDRRAAERRAADAAVAAARPRRPWWRRRTERKRRSPS
jgi:DnaJ-like protein